MIDVLAMSRCTRCGQPVRRHRYIQTDKAAWTYNPAANCHIFTPRDPWWTRTLTRLRRRP